MSIMIIYFKFKNIINCYIFLLPILVYSQVKPERNNVWAAKEYSKEIALYNSKNYLFKTVLGTTSEVTQFEVIPLAAASSGELTTLLYKCENKGKEGLVLGFYGNYWNDNGVLYQGFAFKNLEKDQAVEFLNKIQLAIEENSRYLKDNKDYNNIFFSYMDVDVLIWSSTEGYTIRLFWNNFDSAWEKTAFERSKRRFEKKITN